MLDTVGKTLFWNRCFLQTAPNLNSVMWEARVRYNKGRLPLPYHFYGKFTVYWENKKIGIHSYAEHGYEGAEKFAQKCSLMINQMEKFITVVQNKEVGGNCVQLNDFDTPFSGSIYWQRGTTASGVPICVFELASCQDKIRIHAHDLASDQESGETELCEILKSFIFGIKNLIECCPLIGDQLYALNNPEIKSENV